MQPLKDRKEAPRACIERSLGRTSAGAHSSQVNLTDCAAVGIHTGGRYAECSTQLLHFVSGITLCGINPQLIVIDDFSEMIEDWYCCASLCTCSNIHLCSDERAVLKVLALLCELGQPPRYPVALFVSTCKADPRNCRHQGSDTPNPKPHVLLAGSNDRGSALSRMQHCINRWFPLCYTLAGHCWA